MSFPSFDEFFTAVLGYAPFPWQRRLADFVVAHREFPDSVTAPTGLGKTSAMLAHTYALAHDVAHNGVKGRSYPLRFFHAVERRVVADDASETAEAIAAAVNGADSSDPVLGPIRAALEALVPEEFRDFEPVIAVGAFHGGRRDAGDWLRPIGAVIACATVTQVASRFFFRGVTVSQTMLPMHAAVVGMDSVVAVDEPHLSVPAITAMRQAATVQRDGALIRSGVGDEPPVPLPTVPVSQVVMLGATPPAGVELGTACGIDDEDRAHPVAGRRIRAAKTLQLHQAEARQGDQLVGSIAAVALDAAERDLARGDDPVGGTDGILVFCNSVGMARAVYAKLLKSTTKTDIAVSLIHGKMRSGDRADQPVARGVITVTTQALEVGADFDGFEVITQPCSLSALVQRAGRCNRRGDMPAAQVVMVAGPPPKKTTTVKDRMKGAGLDEATRAIYGELVGEPITIEKLDKDGNPRLTEKGEPQYDVVQWGEAAALLDAIETICGDSPVPFGPDDLAAFIEKVTALVGDIQPPLSRTSRFHVDMARYLARTDPPAPFNVSVLLNGPETDRSLDVTVAWRRDDTLDLLADASVMDAETVTVPIMSLRELLRTAEGETATASKTRMSDLDVGEHVDEKAAFVGAGTLRRVRVRGGDGTWSVPERIGDIKPGTQLVLASSIGGYDETGFHIPKPKDIGPVDDISAAVAVAGGQGRFIADGDLHSTLEAAFNDDAEVQELADSARERYAVPDDVEVTVLPTSRYSNGSDEPQLWFVVIIGTTVGQFTDGARTRCAQLGEHGHQVGIWTAAAAAVLPLDDDVAAALAEAGHRHDDGKADPRFQRALGTTGDPAKVAMAKSRVRSSTERQRMREQAGLPRTWRHEVVSVSDIADDLTAHVVVSHHAHGRPVIIHTDSTADRCGDARISSHAETFARLGDRYGQWGLALLETVMRWCDHRASKYPWSPVQARAAGAPVTMSAPDPLTTPERFTEPEVAHTVRLPGLLSSPLAGVLAAVGLLDVLEKSGTQAWLRWSGDDGCPEIGCDSDISAMIAELRRDPKTLHMIDETLKERGVGKGLEIAKGKVDDPDSVTAGLADTHPLRTLLPGVTKLDKGQESMSTVGIHNNSTVFTGLIERDAGTDAFFSATTGFEDVSATDVKCGGIDTDRNSYPATVTRPDLLAWAMDGSLAIGWAPDAAGLHYGRSFAVLPTPTRWTTVAGYRALVLAAADRGPHATWRRVDPRGSDKMRVWEQRQG
ncbi:type I-U CRISPR-associated helicase/endonuclease Cas3 [Mycobacterium koreense]|nr:type I-U CRISPR-associated helicase/endonuclease Cas3 [Mycolicibacillus koreensis]MCV7247709.1 type I-U CRISPR-associated helicase/endonuclease Cas3 [Mycolicibacillus koreensis]BBY54094.1 hypothetical protein MKOR_13450 [Mycolicibacillus koreensis]